MRELVELARASRWWVGAGALAGLALGLLAGLGPADRFRATAWLLVTPPGGDRSAATLPLAAYAELVEETVTSEAASACLLAHGEMDASLPGVEARIVAVERGEPGANWVLTLTAERGSAAAAVAAASCRAEALIGIEDRSTRLRGLESLERQLAIRSVQLAEQQEASRELVAILERRLATTPRTIRLTSRLDREVLLGALEPPAAGTLTGEEPNPLYRTLEARLSDAQIDGEQILSRLALHQLDLEEARQARRLLERAPLRDEELTARIAALNRRSVVEVLTARGSLSMLQAAAGSPDPVPRLVAVKAIAGLFGGGILGLAWAILAAAVRVR